VGVYRKSSARPGHRSRAMGTPADCFVRAEHDLSLQCEAGAKLRGATTDAAPRGEITFAIGSEKNQKGHTARQQLWVSAVEIKDGTKGRISVTCVLSASGLGYEAAPASPSQRQPVDGFRLIVSGVAVLLSPRIAGWLTRLFPLPQGYRPTRLCSACWFVNPVSRPYSPTVKKSRARPATARSRTPSGRG
jgi:hypothetical protein